MTTPRIGRIALTLTALFLLAGSPQVHAQMGAAQRAAPVRDSLPSEAAKRVLDRIPEPIPASQQVPRPAGVSAPAPSEAADSLRTGEAPDSALGAVPVPAVTQPLVVPSSPGLVMPDTLPSAPVRTPPAAAVVTPPPAAPADGSCWRVQIAAPEQREMAESRREAGQSLLLVPMTIETEGKLHKVRTSGCLTREAADAIRRRAADSGFVGVFVVNTGAGAVAPAKPAAVRKKAATPARRRKK